MMDRQLWRKRDVAGQNQMEPNQMQRVMLKNEADQFQLNRRSRPSHQMMNRHQQRNEGEADLRVPRKRVHQKQRAVKEEVAVGHVKIQHLLRRTQSPLKKNRRKMKMTTAPISNLSNNTQYTLSILV